MQEDLLGLVEQAGVVGTGGAGFPTHVRLKVQADVVIINGAECEPLSRVDQQLIALQAGNLLDILDLLVEQVGVSRGVVALREHCHVTVEALEWELPRHLRLRIHWVGAFYPTGGEQVVIYEMTGRMVPGGGIPLNVDVVVSSVETVLNVLAAARHQAPVIERHVMLTGVVRTPKTAKVSLGIIVAEALALVGGPTVGRYEVIDGGPMMGHVVSIESAIIKTTKGPIVVPEGHSLLQSLNWPVPRTLQGIRVACMQCSLCSEIYPRGLLGHHTQPHKMVHLAAYGALCDPRYTPMNAFLCCSCRLCEYACVMGLQPWRLNGMFKGEMGKKGARNAPHSQLRAAAPFRQYKRYLAHKLIHQLELDGYDVPAPMEDSSCDYQMVTLPLSQGVDAPTQPVVRAGDRVEKRALTTAAPEGKLGADLRASIVGMVTVVTERGITIQQ